MNLVIHAPALRAEGLAFEAGYDAYNGGDGWRTLHPSDEEPHDGRPTFDEAPQLDIDPTECIDCGACVPVCLATAIFALDDLLEKWRAYIETNKNYVDGGNFGSTNIKKQVADVCLGTALGLYEYTARNHS